MNAHPPSTLQTPGFAHYGLAWSPFFPNRIAVASAANFGLVGNGRLHILNLEPQQNAPLPALSLEKQYPTQDGLYDIAWSEMHENQLVTASGDGSLRLWDITLNDLPVRIWQEHTREVFSVDWSNTSKHVFCSSSWDGTVKLWTPDRAHSMTTLQAAKGCVYQALFSPHHHDLIAAAANDGALRLFDLRSPSLMNAPTSFTQPLSTPALTVPPRAASELLTVDWNKYRQLVLATAGTDKVIRIWDCRMLKPGGAGGAAVETMSALGGQCESEMLGHEYAIRKVQWSPHMANVLASASYDMTCRIWTSKPPPGRSHLMQIKDTHTEFVVGCAWSLYDEGLLASCSWDSRVQLHRL